MTNSLHSTSGVAIERATQVEVNSPENHAAQRIYIQTDGEAVGVLPATVSAIPDALTLLMPKVATLIPVRSENRSPVHRLIQPRFRLSRRPLECPSGNPPGSPARSSRPVSTVQPTALS